MKNIPTSSLLETLQADTHQVLLKLKQLQQLPTEKLLQQPAPGRWSVAQVIEHLNTYGRYYLPQLQQQSQKAILHKLNGMHMPSFTPGWLGNYFTNSMRPKADGRVTNKMKAMKSYSPPPALDAVKVLAEFEQQQLQLLDLLEKARYINLSRIRIPISIAPFIKLKMGDVFGFIIAHHQRHFVQIDNTIAVL